MQVSGEVNAASSGVPIVSTGNSRARVLFGASIASAGRLPVTGVAAITTLSVDEMAVCKAASGSSWASNAASDGWFSTSLKRVWASAARLVCG